ncbi:MAG: nicotinate-nucleotide--dimethylbenzimidazole phosphoribosyltransferase [Lachnospiraceae bacterium]|nr:nicotinate-nucleotide--dimethylbenzimidazole phosphoribosyltransferase [Lachnospiraceae bacterium]
MTYQETIEKIKHADPDISRKCRENWDRVAKPLNSLGDFELLTAKIGAASGTEDICIDKRRVLVFCADNGVVEEGISQSDHSVTTAVAKALAEGTSNVNIFARNANAEVEVYDVGMTDDLDMEGLIIRKCANGTKNLAKGPAMTREELLFAIEAGIAAAEKAKADGMDIVVIGEMGIGNTTTSAAVIAILTGSDPEIVTGRGSGLSDEGLRRKVAVIKESMRINQPDPKDALDVLAKTGGFDIAAMCGVILGGAAMHMPVILDGLISCAAACCAKTISPETVDYMIPSHVSNEPAGKTILDHLGLHGPIDAHLALGEGTGGVMLLPLLDMALSLYHGTHRFEDIGIDAYVEQ